MSTPVPRSVYLWVFGVGTTTLLLELLLIRIFDVIVGPTAAYSILTLALLGGSLSGAWMALRPSTSRPQDSIRLSLFFPAVVLLVYAVLQFVPFAVDDAAKRPLFQLTSLTIAVIALSAPFFVSGYILLRVLASYPESARRIYGVDLIGAGLGPWLLSPLLPTLGPVGLFSTIIAVHLLLAGLLHRGEDRPRGKVAPACLSLALVFAVLAGVFSEQDIRTHSTKRSAEETKRRASAEFRHWDPISKIEIADMTETDPATGKPRFGTVRKVISYDGGSQSSHYYPFDGDFANLRANLPGLVLAHFWQRGLLSGHWLLRDTDARIFVVGCSGGQEIKAGLLFGASHIDAVDLVSTVVELGHEIFAPYTGGIFLDERVNYRVQDARQALAQSKEAYDLIQIFSYHNSARLAAGGGAIKAFYLQTRQTYELCFSRLGAEGILAINQAFYPRVVATLAEAWQALGRKEFKRHVVIYSRNGADDHATILIRMRPWSSAELEALDGFLLPEYPGEDRVYTCVEHPIDPDRSALPEGFYVAPLSSELKSQAGFRTSGVTDDQPFAQFLRKHLGPVPVDANRFVDEASSELLSQKRVWGLPRDIAHLFATGTAGWAAFLLLLGLRLYGGAERRLARRVPLGTEAGSWLYFACLGGAFLTLESIWIQYGIQWMARPDLAFPAALSATLVPAGLGSLVSARRPRWAAVSFPAIVLLGLGVGVLLPLASTTVWAWPTSIQLFLFMAGLSLVGFFLGMPLPLALSRLAGSPSVLGWCWTMHGVGTVLGGLTGVAVSLYFGFKVAICFAVIVYGAVGVLARMLGWFGPIDPEATP